MDERVRAIRDTPASSCRESDPEPPRNVASGKHSIYIHFPKDSSCDVCKRTKIKRAPCGEALPRAGNFGDLITADHKVLSGGL